MQKINVAQYPEFKELESTKSWQIQPARLNLSNRNTTFFSVCKADLFSCTECIKTPVQWQKVCSFKMHKYGGLMQCLSVSLMPENNIFKRDIWSLNFKDLSSYKYSVFMLKKQLLMDFFKRKNAPADPTFSLPARSTRYSFPISFCSVSTFSCLMFIRKMLWLRELCSFMSGKTRDGEEDK